MADHAYDGACDVANVDEEDDVVENDMMMAERFVMFRLPRAMLLSMQMVAMTPCMLLMMGGSSRPRAPPRCQPQPQADTTRDFGHGTGGVDVGMPTWGDGRAAVSALGALGGGASPRRQERGRLVESPRRGGGRPPRGPALSMSVGGG